jgi:hypothetical protein
MLEPIVYKILCVLTGFCSCDRRRGSIGTFILAIITAPLVVLPVPLITGPLHRAGWCHRP